ncbi:MFS transporter [Streptomyces sp. NA04227]|uniref:CynX/NimT family MFS transporter n=1 Tax=Streptomyces sp. NA04227 TaxID=2742136 RepID=UPI00158FC036|nr:MFS transporter [Streptomyces sp. NA04227]QKW05755.1 MFS transporter [Streptomyces sp. NA04227]
MMGLMAYEETMTGTRSARPTAPSAEAVTTEAVTTEDTSAPAQNGPSAARTWLPRLVAVAVVLAAVNLRPTITSAGALLEEIRDGLGMSGGVAGLLTSLPSLCFAVFGVTAPRLARRFGPAAVVGTGMAAIATGLLIRPWAGGTYGFLAATALALMGIAVTNVLMPVIVKHWFPDRVGSMTGLYSMALALGTASASATTVPLTEGLDGDWHLGLAAWSALAVLALVPWLVLIAKWRSPARPTGTLAAPATAAESAAPAESAERSGPGPRMYRSRTAWSLALFFGLQATGAYVTMGWMAQIFRDAGVAAGMAGLLVAVTMVMGVPLAFVIPRLAGRLPHQGPIVVALGLCGLTGYAGLWAAPAGGAWAWAVLLGISNCAFPLALTMIGMRSRTSATVASLSGFVQSTGYLLSIPGPILVGVLYQHSGGWSVPLALMAALMVPQTVVGVLAGRPRTVEDEAATRA